MCRCPSQHKYHVLKAGSSSNWGHSCLKPLSCLEMHLPLVQLCWCNSVRWAWFMAALGDYISMASCVCTKTLDQARLNLSCSSVAKVWKINTQSWPSAVAAVVDHNEEQIESKVYKKIWCHIIGRSLQVFPVQKGKDFSRLYFSTSAAMQTVIFLFYPQTAVGLVIQQHKLFSQFCLLFPT